MFKTALSSCGKEINEELFKAYADADIMAMEISLAYDECDEFDYKKALELSKKYGVELWSYHLPFGPFETNDISNPDIAGQTVEYLSGLIEKGSDIGIDKYIIHPSGEPIADEDRKMRMECSKDSLFKLAEIAKACGSVLAVEDLPRTCLGRNSAEIKELTDVHPDLGVCFDTNHLLSEKIEEFILSVGDRIITTHVSDYDFVNERHWLPGEGKINWASLIDALKKVNYQGVWLYEIGFACPKNIIRDRSLNCEDFARNARELFEGKEITVFSKHIENLGFSND